MLFLARNASTACMAGPVRLSSENNCILSICNMAPLHVFVSMWFQGYVDNHWRDLLQRDTLKYVLWEQRWEGKGWYHYKTCCHARACRCIAQSSSFGMRSNWSAWQPATGEWYAQAEIDRVKGMLANSTCTPSTICICACPTYHHDVVTMHHNHSITW